MSFESLKANLHEYQLRHLIRAHSAGGNVSDRTTPVNDAAFELAPDKNEFVGTLNETLSYTNICATCGLNIVNLIDTESGKIVKRFSDDAFVNRLKEVYYRLAWTVLNGSSVLVAAGEHGQLKVILPKISSCLARIDAHSKPIRSLLFDYKYKNILFTGSEDHEIKIWRLDIKEGKTDLECECSCELLGTIEYNTSNKNSERVNSMCFLPDRYLLISTELGNYYVKVNLRKMLKAKEKKADGNKLENIDENISKDKALEFMMSTDSADKKDNRFTAESIKIETTSGKRHSTVVKTDFISNSLIFINNLLYINEIGSKNLHVIEVETGEDKLKLKFIDTLVISEDKCTVNSRTSYFIENETSYILNASSEGRLNCCELDAFGRKLKMVLEYELPSDYTIKPVGMAAVRTEVKNYDLFDRARVLYATSSDNSIVAVTDQNIIAVFKRFIPATANVVINLNMVQIQ